MLALDRDVKMGEAGEDEDVGEGGNSEGGRNCGEGGQNRNSQKAGMNLRLQSKHKAGLAESHYPGSFSPLDEWSPMLPLSN